MGPLASKVLKELRRSRSNVVSLAAARDVVAFERMLAAKAEDLAGLPSGHRQWMLTFGLLAQFGHAVAELHALRKLRQRVAEADEEYMPGEPPMSPVMDSFFMSHWMADLPCGPARETLLGIVAEIAPALSAPPWLRDCARTLAESRVGVYRVEAIGAHRVRLTELVTEAVVEAALPDDLTSRAPLWLARVLPPPPGEGSGDFVVWTTPYELIEGEDAWREYFERVLAGVAPGERGAALARHCKSLDDGRRWLEYILLGYAGQDPSTGAIGLAGVPDRPASLPHHPEYEHEAASPAGLSALERVRIKLIAIGRKPPFDPEGGVDHAELRNALGAPVEPLVPEMASFMRLAYVMYGQLDERDRTPLDVLAADASLPADERAILHALREGWFSVFEVRRVRVDEGMELHDVLRRKKLWVVERSATRGVQLGDVIAGWVMVEQDKTTLEGALCHVPARIARDFCDALIELHRVTKRGLKGVDWKKQAAVLAPYVVPIHDDLFASAPPPELVNTSGDALLWSTAHYAVRDVAAARGALDAWLGAASAEGSYSWVVGETVHAHLELTAGELRVECNSRRRLDAAKAQVAERLGDAVAHQLDEHFDPAVEMAKQRVTRPRDGSEARRSKAPPPEAADVIQQTVLDHMRKWIDEPIPLLDGKTPRQAVRSARGRDDVTHLLVRQQAIFDGNEQLPRVDLSEIWTSLGLTPR